MQLPCTTDKNNSRICLNTYIYFVCVHFYWRKCVYTCMCVCAYECLREYMNVCVGVRVFVRARVCARVREISLCGCARGYELFFQCVEYETVTQKSNSKIQAYSNTASCYCMDFDWCTFGRRRYGEYACRKRASALAKNWHGSRVPTERRNMFLSPTTKTTTVTATAVTISANNNSQSNSCTISANNNNRGIITKNENRNYNNYGNDKSNNMINNNQDQRSAIQQVHTLLRSRR